jgi:hypothetical protein
METMRVSRQQSVHESQRMTDSSCELRRPVIFSVIIATLHSFQPYFSFLIDRERGGLYRFEKFLHTHV